MRVGSAAGFLEVFAFRLEYAAREVHPDPEREISLDAKFALCEVLCMRFDEFMLEEGLTLTRAAGLLKKPVSTVHGWKSGRRLPSATDLAAIENLTKGKVTARDFVESAEVIAGEQAA